MPSRAGTHRDRFAMPRPLTTACLAALVLLIAAGCSEDATAPIRSPGAAVVPGEGRIAKLRPKLIVMISLDTLRADHLGFLGYDRPTSPSLDAFAARSVIFEDATSPSPWTLPSHASMLTGLYPKRHQVVSPSSKLPNRTSTLASDLERAGYKTHAVVNSPWLRVDTFGFMRGFERTLFVKGGGARVGPNTLVTDQAITWIERASKKPKFVFIHYIDAHSDYVSLPQHEARFLRPYEGKVRGTTRQLLDLRVTDAFLESCRNDETQERCHDNEGKLLTGLIRKSALDGDGLRHLVDRYDAGIHQLDSELSRLFDSLEANDLMKDAVIVVTADHGEELMDHGSLFHAGSQYQEVIRVPLLIRAPGLPMGKRITTPVSLVDLAPTILEFAYAPAMVAIDGQSLAPLWRDEDPSAFTDRDVFAEAPGEYSEMVGLEHFHVLRHGRFKLHHELSANRFELYDLEADPAEKHDLTEERPQIFEELRERLVARHAEDGSGPSSPTTGVELSEESKEELRALGYLE